MINWIKISICFFLLISCTVQNHEIEDQVIECLFEKSIESGVDLRLELLKFENYLIETGVLISNNGQSYYDIYKEIEKGGNIDFNIQYSLLDTILKKDNIENINEFQSNCIKLIHELTQSEKYKSSKLYLLNNSLDSISDLKPSSVAKAITDILTPLDFEHDYYKMTTLLTLSMFSDFDYNIIRELPSKIDEKKNVIPSNAMEISVDSTDIIRISGNIVLVGEIESITKRYISKNLEKSYISLSHTRNINYDVYIEIQNEIMNGLESLRNNYSLDNFGKQYKDLNENEVIIVRKIYPNCIYEGDIK